MKKYLHFLLFAGMAALPGMAHAEDAPAPDITVTGTVAALTQYRLRGVSQSDQHAAIQGSLTVVHKSGLYVGAWGSNLAGFGTFGGSNLEVDAIVGYSHTIDKTLLDGGFIGYFYPGTNGHQYIELYGDVVQPIGPVKAKVGANYAFKRQSTGNHDNIWVYGELAAPIPATPVTLRGHVGYTDGKGSIFSGPSGHYVDYSVGADAVWKNLTFNLSYIGTDINRAAADSYYAVPGAKPGRDIVSGAVVLSLTAGF